MRWRYGVLVGIFLALLSMYPQAVLIYERGSNYNGATFVNDNDESVYVAYLQAIIDGRPRKNNIYSGSTETPPETFLSIQALPAYVAAIPLKAAGVDAERGFLFLSVISAFSASVFLFWFLSKVTGNSSFAAFATLFVLVMGMTVAGYGVLKYFIGINPASASMPFLRRYTPGLVFPFVFILFTSVWLGYEASERSKRVIYAGCASACFGILVYSYFYLWTAAAAWLATLALLTVILKPDGWRDLIKEFWLPVFAFCIACAIPYLILVLQRAESTDDAQALEITRQFVFRRPSIWLGLLIVLVLIAFVKYRRTALDKRLALFIASFALLPAILFNQQIVTGYSLQPFHYNLYAAPYAALISLVLLAWALLNERLSNLKVSFYVVPIAAICVWGAVESHYVTQYRLAGNIARDEAISVARRLSDIGRLDPNTSRSEITFNANEYQADNQPAIAPQGVLWSEHLPWVSSLSAAAARHRYFQHLYFMNKGISDLRRDLEQCPGSAACKALFGWRAIPTLSVRRHDPSQEEIESLITEFEAFLQNFNEKNAYDPSISYAVVPASPGFDFTRIDKWYVREGKESHGIYEIYRLHPLDTTFSR